MWAVDLKQSHEIPNAWIENASDLNSVLGKKKKRREKTPTLLLLQRQSYVWKTETKRELWEQSKYLEKGLML